MRRVFAYIGPPAEPSELGLVSRSTAVRSACVWTGLAWQRVIPSCSGLRHRPLCKETHFRCCGPGRASVAGGPLRIPMQRPGGRRPNRTGEQATGPDRTELGFSVSGRI